MKNKDISLRWIDKNEIKESTHGNRLVFVTFDVAKIFLANLRTLVNT